QVHAALSGLRERDREVLLLSAWEELSNSQIATVLGCSVEAAAQRVHRAKQRLGRSFRAQPGNESPSNSADGSENA
ncbi:MAG: RNA polymerase sigma factor, partial [Acidimicrobiia bacterium]